MSKSYQLTPGTCENCTLEFNCRDNKENLLDFLRSLGLKECSTGYVYKIKIIEKSVDSSKQ